MGAPFSFHIVHLLYINILIGRNKNHDFLRQCQQEKSLQYNYLSKHVLLSYSLYSYVEMQKVLFTKRNIHLRADSKIFMYINTDTIIPDKLCEV